MGVAKPGEIGLPAVRDPLMVLSYPAYMPSKVGVVVEFFEEIGEPLERDDLLEDAEGVLHHLSSNSAAELNGGQR